MAISTVAVLGHAQLESKLVRPIQIPAKWFTIIDAGVAGVSLSGLEQQDAAALTDPDAEITNSTTHLFKVGRQGTTLLLRMKYDDGLSAITDPVLRVFGRYDSTEPWMMLNQKGGADNATVTMQTASTDVSDGTDNWTDVDEDDHSFDLRGCDEILVGVQTALAATGDPTLASLEAKII